MHAPSEDDFLTLMRNAIVFARALRANGFRAQPDRLVVLGQAWETVGLRSRDDARSAARSVLARSKEECDRFDAAFDAIWASETSGIPGEDDRRSTGPVDGRPKAPAVGRDDRRSTTQIDRRPERPAVDGSGRPPLAHDDSLHAIEGDRSFTYSFAEGLYAKDFAKLSALELARARELTKRTSWDLGRRVVRRTKRGRGGDRFDAQRTLRTSLRRGGEIVALETRVRRTKQRDLVLLCDISGSMDRYSRLLLQFVHAVRHAVGKVEAFVFGTKLTRITRQLRHREIQEAIDDVAASVSDWAGGTRIGESIHAFNERWGRRVLGRGAIVVIVSDGWDRGDVDLLAREMRRLQRSAYRLIWLNPLLGSAGYRPQTIGMRAALPYVDDFLPANNLKNLVQLAALLNAVDMRRPARAQRAEVS